MTFREEASVIVNFSIDSALVVTRDVVVVSLFVKKRLVCQVKITPPRIPLGDWLRDEIARLI
jgi:hypothetical protein